MSNWAKILRKDCYSNSSQRRNSILTQNQQQIDSFNFGKRKKKIQFNFGTNKRDNIHHFLFLLTLLEPGGYNN